MATAKKGRKRSGFVRILMILNTLFVLLLLSSYAAPYISPEKYWIFAFSGLAYPVFLAVNVLFVLIWILSWNRFIWVPLIAILLGFNHLTGIIHIRVPGSGKDSGKGIKVLTYNVHSLYGISNTKITKGVRSKVTDFLIQQKPDILCIQEFYIKSPDSTKVLERFAESLHLDNFFFKNYYLMKDSRKINALTIFTRYPVAGSGFFQLKGRNVFAIYTDLLIGKDTIRVYNLHLESIRFGNEDYSFYSHLTEAETEKFDISGSSLKIFGKLKKAFIMRSQQVDILKESIRNSPHPVIICGDFNDTPTSYTYHELSDGLSDSFRHSGKAFLGPTYAGTFPSFRIDFILFDPEFRVKSYQKYDVNLSDHYPVSAFIDTNAE